MSLHLMRYPTGNVGLAVIGGAYQDMSVRREATHLKVEG